MVGSWKSLLELEDNLTMEELLLILDTAREQRDNHNKFLAAINQIDLDKANGPDEDPVERAKIKAAAELAGKNPEQYELEMLGFDFETL